MLIRKSDQKTAHPVLFLFVLLLLLTFKLTTKAQPPQLELVKPGGSPAQVMDFPNYRIISRTDEIVDIDGDGDNDVIVFTGQPRNYRFFINDGVGNYSEYEDHPAMDLIGTSRFDVIRFAFVNDDAYIDVLAGKQDEPARLYFGDSMGNFNDSGIEFHDSWQGNIEVLDFDSDGDQDVLVAGHVNLFPEESRVILYRNDGSENFTADAVLNLDNIDFREIAVSETYDGDKRNVFISVGNDVWLYQYDDTTDEVSLISQTIFTGLPSGGELEIDLADANEDGLDDVLIVGEKIHLFVNSGGTSFTVDTTVPFHNAEGSTLSVKNTIGHLADFDNDGVAEFIHISANGVYKFYENNGTGGFTLFYTEQISSATGTYFQYGDLNNDNLIDILFAKSTDSDTFSGERRRNGVLLNNGDNTFIEDISYTLRDAGEGSVLAGDFDNDNDIDLFLTGTDFFIEGAHSNLYLNDGDGNFTSGAVTLGQEFTSSVAITSDINQDGYPDIIISGKRNSSIVTTVYHIDESSTFTQASGYPFTGVIDGDIVSFDANGDYNPDLLFVGQNTQGREIAWLYLGTGEGNFKRKYVTGLTGITSAAAANADIDQDGDQDLILTGKIEGTATSKIYQNDGDGNFTEVGAGTLPAIESGDLVLTDFSGDNLPDLLIAGSDTLVVYLNDGVGGFTVALQEIGTSQTTITTTDIDEDGDLDFLLAGLDGFGKTKLYLNDGTGSFTQSDIRFHGVTRANLITADFDGDFDDDLLVVGSESTNATDLVSADATRMYENATTLAIVTESVIACDQYFFVDESLTTSGLYSKTVTTPEGGTRIINLSLTINSNTSQTLDIQAYDSYSFNGRFLVESGSYTTNFHSSTGCDSLVTINLTINQAIAKVDRLNQLFELVQPDGSPEAYNDFDLSRDGNGVFYDMDGDGDTDYLQYGYFARGNRLATVYLNDGTGQYIKQLNSDEMAPLPNSYEYATFAWGDLNKDGINDLLIGGDTYERNIDGIGYNDESAMFWGTATGHLIENTDISLMKVGTGNFTIADINNDGHLDIVASGPDASGIYYNNGDETFTLDDTVFGDLTFGGNAVSQRYETGELDIVISGFTRTPSFAILTILYRADEMGNVTKISDSFFPGSSVVRHLFGDGNNDGIEDLMITGTDFFRTRVNHLYFRDALGNYVSSYAIFDNILTGWGLFEDLNRDGAAEVILFELDEEDFHVFWNDGYGQFGTAATYSYRLSNNRILVQDINDDGWPDILANARSSDTPETYQFINGRDNSFTESTLSVFSGVYRGDIKVADLNGDLLPDLLAVGTSTTDYSTTLYAGDGDGGFSEVSSSFAPLRDAQVAIADLDGNLTKDVIMIGDSTGTGGAALASLIYLNDGSGNFTMVEGHGITAVKRGKVIVLNADANVSNDLLIMGLNESNESVAALYLNDGTGAFTLHDSGISPTENPSVSAGDIDDDNDIDLVISGTKADGDPSVTLYLNDGSGNFSVQSPNNFDAISNGEVRLVDLNGDGYPDLYVGGDGLQVTYKNDGTGSFSFWKEFEPITENDVDFADLDGDTDIDFVATGELANGDVATKVYLNDGNGNFSVIEFLSMPGVKNGTLELADFNNDGNPDVFYSGNLMDDYGNLSRVYKNMVGTPRRVTWAQADWVNKVAPADQDYVIIRDDYSLNADGSFEMGVLEIRENNTVTVEDGSTLDVTGDLSNDGEIIVASGGSLLTYAANEVTGNPVTIHRNTRFATASYSMVGTPVRPDAGIKGNQLGSFVYAYDESVPYAPGAGVSRWLDATVTELEPGKGYAAAGQKEMTFVGTPNSGTIGFTGLSRTEDMSSTADNWGWHLMSNPYPAAIDLSKFLATNTGIQGFIALWDDPDAPGTRGSNADYLVVNAIGSVSGPNGGQFEGYINSMQGFFIQVGAGQSGDVSFTESMRVAGNNGDATFFRQERDMQVPGFKLKVTTDEFYSETLVGFPGDATPEVDRLYDAPKIKGQNDLNVYSLINDLPYAIQGLPLHDEQVRIPIGIASALAQTINFELKELHDLFFDYDIYLIDKYLSNAMKVNNEIVSTTVSGGQTNDRFELLIKPRQADDTNQVLGSAEVQLTDHQILIQTVDQRLVQQAVLTDLNGRVVRNVQDLEGIRHLLKPTAPGIFILRMQYSDGATETIKLLLGP